MKKNNSDCKRGSKFEGKDRSVNLIMLIIVSIHKIFIITDLLTESRRDTYGHLILDASDVEQRLDLLPQLPPRPGAELEVLPQVPLDDHEGQALLLEFLVILTGQVTPDVSLHPGHDLAKTLVAKLLHLTQDSGTEEYLFLRERRKKLNIERERDRSP